MMSEIIRWKLRVTGRFCYLKYKNSLTQKLRFPTLALRNTAFTRITGFSLIHDVFLFSYLCTHRFVISQSELKIKIRLFKKDRRYNQN